MSSFIENAPKEKAPTRERRGLLRKLGDYAVRRLGWCEACVEATE